MASWQAASRLSFVEVHKGVPALNAVQCLAVKSQSGQVDCLEGACLRAYMTCSPREPALRRAIMLLAVHNLKRYDTKTRSDNGFEDSQTSGAFCGASNLVPPLSSPVPYTLGNHAPHEAIRQAGSLGWPRISRDARLEVICSSFSRGGKRL